VRDGKRAGRRESKVQRLKIKRVQRAERRGKIKREQRAESRE
jgi:hypothetical protein